MPVPEDVNGHDLALEDLVEVVSASSAQKVGLRARVDSVREDGLIDLRWDEHPSGGARHWLVKGEYVRFVERPGHDCAVCAVAHVTAL